MSLPWDPQELELLGAQMIGNTSRNWTQTCFLFGNTQQGFDSYKKANFSGWTNVTAGGPYKYQNAGDFCGTNDTKGYLRSLGAYGVAVKQNDTIWNNLTAKALPSHIFLICGDRAWQGIPAQVIGGPCYLGKLTMFAPNMAQLHNLTRHLRSKHAFFNPGCNDEVKLLSVAARTAFAIFVPGAAAANALANPERFACWSEKQDSVTTKILEQMLLDKNNLRHALQQNRAAIDFLLLAQGHGCKDFEGMCCLNFSDHSEPTHKSIEYLKEHMGKIQHDMAY